MTFSGDNDVIDAILYDVNGSMLVVTGGQVVSSNQPMLISAGLIGSMARALMIDASGSLVITGTVGVGGPHLVVSGPSPLNVTGSVTISTTMGSYAGRIEGLTPHSASSGANPVLVGGFDGSKTLNLLVDGLGRIITAPAGSSLSVTSSLNVGYVATTNIVLSAVRSTAYTEQTTNAQRSLVSSNASDSATGTGARSVTLTYLDQNMNGPYTVTVTLNGTTAVNTGVSNICFIEEMKVETVGSTGANVGTISLRSTTGGGGTTIASIAPGNNQLFYAMHYVPSGKTTYVTGISTGNDGTNVAHGAEFTIRAKKMLVSDAPEIQVSDFINQFGQANGLFRSWETPIKVVGPARIQVYVLPQTTTDRIQRCAMDLYDQ